MDKYCVLTIHISEVTYLMTTHPPSGSTQIINQPPDIWHCDKHRQAQFSRQFFVANQASVGRGQADFFSMGSTLC